MEKQNKDMSHSDDDRFIAPTPPNGYVNWFQTFKGTRAYSRIEKELNIFKSQHNEEAFALLRVYVYQGCFRARTWDTDNATIIASGKKRKTLLSDAPNAVKALKQVERFLSTHRESDGIGSHVWQAMREKGHTISKDGGRYHSEDHPVLDVISSLKDVLVMIESSDPKGHIPANPGPYDTWIYPSPGGTHYLCFRYPEWCDLSCVKRPSRQTALTIYLSSLFRMFTADRRLLNIILISDLMKVGGKPYWKIAATTCLCALDGASPISTDIDIAADTAKTFAKNHGDISITIDW